MILNESNTSLPSPQLGRYFIIERLATGGTGEIYKAKFIGIEGFEKIVVIKQILPQWSTNQNFVTMLIDEAKIMVRLRHERVVQVHELGRQGDIYYIVMEYVPGMDLRRFVELANEKQEPIQPEEAIFIVSEVLKGLDYIHKQKDDKGQNLRIVHRDISPQNILVSIEGLIKITDFGIAHAAFRSYETATGVLKGKFAYMSPEQVRGLVVDQRTDLFAVGIIFFELLTGSRLFWSGSDLNILERIKNFNLMEITKNAHIAKCLKPVLSKALNPNLEDRYSSAYEFLKDLKDLGKFFKSGYDADQLASHLNALRLEHIVTNSKNSFPPIENPELLEQDNKSILSKTLVSSSDSSHDTSLTIAEDIRSLKKNSGKEIRKNFMLFQNGFFATKIMGLTVIFFTILIASLLFFKKFEFPLNVFKKDVPYTKNPPMKKIPFESIVKIIVDQGTDHESSGSGLLFNREGYILTNAHVITTPLGKSAKDIKVCYSTSNNQDVKCEYEAGIVDADRAEDLAVIKTNREMREVSPYPLLVEENDESWVKEIVPLGTELKAIGFPGIGGNSITLTRGVVSGYKNGEIIFDDGSLQKIPFFIKTDTEINHGNSGGAVFDKDNRYVGISTAIKKDDGGKLSFIIFWNKINSYLNHLIFKGVLTLHGEQYVRRSVPQGEKNLWGGLRAFFSEDYKNSATLLEKYIQEKEEDSRGWFYLCNAYQELADFEKMQSCAEHLRNINPKASAISWFLTSLYYKAEKNDDQKAYDAVNKGLSFNPDFNFLLERKARLEITLDKKEEAKKTTEKILRLGEMESEGFYLRGVLALKDQDFDMGLKFLELSFDIKPSPDTADVLSAMYYAKFEDSGNLKDLIASLTYLISHLILNEKGTDNIPSFIRMVNLVTTLFESDKNASWGNSLKTIKELMGKLEVDKNLVEPIVGISDQQIRQYLRPLNGKEEVSQEAIESIRSFVKMTMAWLYTLMEEKVACQNQFTEVDENPSFFTNLRKVPLDNAKSIIVRNILMKCLCMTDDYSTDIIRTCYQKNIAALR